MSMNQDQPDHIDESAALAVEPAAAGTDPNQDPAEAPAGDDAASSDTPSTQEPSPAAAAAGAVAPKKESRLDLVLAAMGLKDKPKAEVNPDIADPTAAVADPLKPAAPASAAVTPAAKPGEPATIVVPPEVANHPAYKALAEQTTALSHTVQQLSDQAGRMAVVERRIAETGTDPKDVSNSINLAIMASENPEAFYAEIVKIENSFAVALGKRLPVDLQKDVDEGVISQERAQELSRTRITAETATAQATRATKVVQSSAAENNLRAIENVTGSWFEAQGKKDPDMGMKVDAIAGEFLRLTAGKEPPKSATEIRALLDQSHKNVTGRMQAVRPKTPVRPGPSSSALSSRESGTPQKKNTRLSMVESILARGESA